MKDGNDQNHLYFDQCSHLLLLTCPTLTEMGKFPVKVWCVKRSAGMLCLLSIIYYTTILQQCQENFFKVLGNSETPWQP